MGVKVYIPTPLRVYVDNQEALDLEGSNVEEVLASLTQRYEELKKHLFNEEGKLRNFVNIYVNDEDIRYLQREKTPVKDDDTVSIVPSIAGGASGGGLSHDEVKRYSRHLIMPGGRYGRAEEAQEHQCPVRGGGWLGLTVGIVFDRGRHRPPGYC